MAEQLWRGPIRPGETAEGTITHDRGDGWVESFGAVRVDGVLIEDFDAAVERVAQRLAGLEWEFLQDFPHQAAEGLLRAAVGKER